MCWACSVHRIVQALAADGLEVAAGTLCGALKQVAPLIAPWAEAIAAHGRTAGHVHADETSWQVFEDIEDKDGLTLGGGGGSSLRFSQQLSREPLVLE